MKRFIMIVLGVLVLVLWPGCDAASANDDELPGSTQSLPDVFERFSDDVAVYVEGEYVVLRSNGVPDHSSPYFSTSDARYAPYDGDNANFRLNPNRITEHELVLYIPLNPQEATANEATPLGPIGMAVNGVAIYNQYAGPSRPLTSEINSFDQYNGHPQQTGQYHYHVEPLYLTATRGDEALIGFLLDGFPVYGPVENGRPVTNADLDALHGHTGPTADHPGGVYHYHITVQDPYINGAGFFGKSGFVSR